MHASKSLGLLSLALGALLSAGCGGGGSGGSSGGHGSTMARFDTTITTSSAVLDDGAHFASLGLVASGSGPAVVTVTSSAFDPMVVVERLNDDGTLEVVAEDDDGGGGTDGKASFTVAAGARYTVLATSASGDPRGAVTIGYSSKVLTPDGRSARRSAKTTQGGE